ncbi:hypothetical protein GQ53DRAFT_847810 [Thozetella sp. PMI_491]|nr:hypothetical protein GQ53DRAFT_847810 [Thozetella sp. PMI_491]
MVVLAALSALVALSCAQSLSLRDINNPTAAAFRRRSWHEVIVVDDYLYIYGGEVNNTDNTEKKTRPVNTTLSLDLSSSWTNTSVKFTESDGSGSKFYKNPTLWKDPLSSSFFVVGGESAIYGVTDEATNALELMKYTVDGKGSGSWSSSQPSNPDILNQIKGTGAAAAADCAGVGLYTGSYVNDDTQPKSPTGWSTITGMITYNSSSRAWTNESTDPFVHAPLYPEMVCLPSYGTNGLVMFLGGATSIASDRLDAPAFSLMSFSNLTFYDPLNKKWYWQAATGDVPEGRIQFCAVSVQSSNGTAEIFVYGGATKSGDTLGDVHILTIPGFQWFKGQSGTTRTGNRCVVGKGRQMITIGGLETPGDAMGGWSTADSLSQGIGVLDMTALEWTSAYDTNAPKYTYPDVVKSWYDGGGMSTVFWSSGATKTLFAPAQQSGTSSTNSTSGTNSTSKASDESASSANVGAIAGGTVGGVAAVGIAGIAWFLLRRRRKPADPEPAYEPDPKPPANESYIKPELDSENQQLHELYDHGAAQEYHELPANMHPEAELAANNKTELELPVTSYPELESPITKHLAMHQNTTGEGKYA